MKKVLAIMLILLATGIGAQAQDSTAKKVSMREAVGLTKEVDQQIKDIKTEYKTKEQTLLADATIDEKTKKAKKKELKEERETKINALLTKEQQAKYLEYKEAAKAAKEAQEKKD